MYIKSLLFILFDADTKMGRLIFDSLTKGAFNKKYSKTVKFVKYYYNLNQLFSMWICVKL